MPEVVACEPMMPDSQRRATPTASKQMAEES
jgi:hypothetical protein